MLYIIWGVTAETGSQGCIKGRGISKLFCFFRFLLVVCMLAVTLLLLCFSRIDFSLWQKTKHVHYPMKSLKLKYNGICSLKMIRSHWAHMPAPLHRLSEPVVYISHKQYHCSKAVICATTVSFWHSSRVIVQGIEQLKEGKRHIIFAKWRHWSNTSNYLLMLLTCLFFVFYCFYLLYYI